MLNSLSYKFSRLFWSIYFVVTIAAIGLGCGYVVTFAIYFLALLLSPFPRASERVRIFGELFQCFSIRILLRIQPWLRCETNLAPIYGFYDQFKTRKVLFVGNHRSNLDTFLLISYIPGLRGLAKKSLFQNIFFAPFMWGAGFIPVDKGSMASFMSGLKDLKTKILDRNRAVLIFPENTRCKKGETVLQKFSGAVFSVAIESGAVIVPIALKNTDQLLGRGDFLLHPYQKVEVKMLEPILASQYEDSQILRETVWNSIQAGLR